MQTPSTIRVLLVEDSPTDALITVHALTSRSFEVQSTDRLTAALDLLSAGNFDVVLLDLGLPDSQGLDTLRTFRIRNSRVPVVVLTGRDDEVMALHALQEGAQDYLVKGQVHDDVLGRSIRYAIERNQAETALREASDFNRQIIASAQEGIIVLDRDLRYRVWNQYMESLSGVRARDVLGKHPWQVFPFITESAGRAALEGGLAGATMILPDIYVEAKSPGRSAWVWQQISPLRDTLGRIIGAICTVRDISDRKHAETVLRERSQLASLSADVGQAFTEGGTLPQMLQRCVESMVANLGAAFARIWTLNKTENVLELQASAGLYSHLDGPHSRIPVGKFKIGRIAEEKKPHLTNDVPHDPWISDPEWARREGMVAFCGHPLLLEDRLVGVMAIFARENLGEATIQAMAAVADQITLGIERKQTEFERNSVLARLQLHIERMPLAYVLFDANLHVTDWNPAAESIFGYSMAEALGLNLFDLIPETFRAEMESLLDRIRRGDMMAHSQNENLTKDGRRIICEWLNTPLFAEDGSFAGLICLARDITGRKLLEE